jgi:Ca-activated chloride channel family protein
MRAVALPCKRHYCGWTRWVLWVLAWLCISVVAARTAHADGFIIPDPLPDAREAPGLAVKYHRVRVTIRDQIAQTHIDQVFLNDSPHDLEGTYIFPLPREASISDFAMFVDGERLSARVLDQETARRIYEDIVRQRRDPALLEYVGREAFQARVYPIPAFGEKRVQIAYEEVLLAEQGLVHYVYPLDTERFSSRPLEEVVISVELQSRVPIKAIYSPSHTIVVERSGDRSARVSFEATDVRPDTDFELYYSLSEQDVGLSVLSYKAQDEDGFFLLMVAPQVEDVDRTAVAKDVILVLDTSGSMEGQKLDQAKGAARFVLERLNPEDRFNIVAFSTGVTKFASRWQIASARREAIRFVNDLSAGGGTNIDRALSEALTMARGERPEFVLFLTDGLPTEGVTDLQDIIDNVDRAARDSLRLFTFGVGYDVNTILLDTISQEHRGASAYVEPSESIEQEVAAFYSKISMPLLSDLRLDVEGVLVEDTFPYPLPDLFAGSQLLVAGRYRDGGRATVTLQGTSNDERRVFVYEGIEFKRLGGQEAIPRLWATRKIGHLLREIRLHGENPELVDHIVSLSVRYGIMTPYTSFLMDEDEEILTASGRSRIASQSPLATPMLAPASGARAVSDSQTQNKLAEADVGGGEEAAGIKWVADRAFVLREGVWTDTTYDPQDMRTTGLAFGSAAYFKLLSQHPEWGKYFALGERVIVVLDGTAYEIVPTYEDTAAMPPAAPGFSPWEQFWNWFRSVAR